MNFIYTEVGEMTKKDQTNLLKKDLLGIISPKFFQNVFLKTCGQIEGKKERPIFCLVNRGSSLTTNMLRWKT